MSTKQKQPKAKKAGKPRKAQKSGAAASVLKAERPARAPDARERDPRIPAVGTTLTRVYKGKEHRLKVLADGFEYGGETFRSLTAAAKRATGYPSIAGTDWWGVSKRPAATSKAKRKPAAPTEAAAAVTAPQDSASV